MHHMNTPRSNDRIRLTISVTPEVHAAFQRLSGASGMSISRVMGEWLGDTLEAVEYTTLKIEEARTAPARVMREVHALATGVAEGTQLVLDRLAAGAAKGGAGTRAPADAPAPPSSNTGGKVPRKPKQGRERDPGGSR